MKMHPLAIVAAAVVGAAGISACHRSAELSDAQLTQLLRAERATPTDPTAPLDPGAVDCLRAWSGDADLAKNLPPPMVADPGKKACRQRIEGWLADPTRNPKKTSFANISTPASVRQAVALLGAHRALAHLPSGMDRPPAALMRPGMPAATPAAAPQPSGPVDMTAATAAVDELEALCQQAQTTGTSAPATTLGRYARFCGRRLEQLRGQLQTLAVTGNPRTVQVLTQNVQHLVTVGHQIANGRPDAPSPAQ